MSEREPPASADEGDAPDVGEPVDIGTDPLPGLDAGEPSADAEHTGATPDELGGTGGEQPGGAG
ncbi:MAG: hypothetical protein NVSMB13_02370 [Mycobacteriales bacterium]